MSLFIKNCTGNMDLNSLKQATFFGFFTKKTWFRSVKMHLVFTIGSCPSIAPDDSDTVSGLSEKTDFPTVFLQSLCCTFLTWWHLREFCFWRESICVRMCCFLTDCMPCFLHLFIPKPWCYSKMCQLLIYVVYIQYRLFYLGWYGARRQIKAEQTEWF